MRIVFHTVTECRNANYMMYVNKLIHKIQSTAPKLLQAQINHGLDVRDKPIHRMAAQPESSRWVYEMQYMGKYLPPHSMCKNPNLNGKAKDGC